MDKMPIDVIYKNQQDYFLTGETRNLGFRLSNLKRLRRALYNYEPKLFEAVKKDLNKSNYEAYVSELSQVYGEITHALLNLHKWATKRKVKGSKEVLPSTSYIYSEPYGNVLVISPWNYPIYLSLMPVIGALAAGNTVILKPSELSIHTSAVLEEMITEFFDSNLLKVVKGGVEVSQHLLQKPFDYIFFTGSTAVGKNIMKAAAEHLTPVTLELGGKSPAIIDKTTDLDVTAKRLVWGKFLNAGQTCVSPDFLYVHESIKDELLQKMKEEIHEMYGDDPSQSEDYPRIISDKHFNRLLSLIDNAKVFTGGQSNAADRYISPTIMDNCSWDDAVMQDEIFGPILPVMSYSDLDSIIQVLERKPKPLAFYVFTSSKEIESKLFGRLSFGGGVLNDTVLHLGNKYLPFGGVGASGMGAYHGKHSFDTFSHQKSILKRGFKFDFPFRYAPYKDKLSWVRKLI